MIYNVKAMHLYLGDSAQQNLWGEQAKPGKPPRDKRISAEEKIRRDLENDKARYQELLELGNDVCSLYDLMCGYDCRFNLHLVGNHIVYDMRALAELPGQTKLSNEVPAKYESPFGCPYEVTPWKYRQTTLLEFMEGYEKPKGKPVQQKLFDDDEDDYSEEEFDDEPMEDD